MLDTPTPLFVYNLLERAGPQNSGNIRLLSWQLI
jgi:hypothetical protein